MFKSIGIISKPDDPKVEQTLKKLLNFLEHRECQIAIDSNTCQHLPNFADNPMDVKQMGQKCDTVIVVGGDGTLLAAARNLAIFNVPVIGVNLGRLGFLVDISPEDLESKLEGIFDGQFDSEERGLLQLEIRSNGSSQTSDIAFNDIVLHKWNTSRMIEFEVSIDGHFVESQRSDGLIIATPTGSTAYALSGGGPILHPTMAACVLVPICTHTFSNRPIVISDEHHIELRVCEAYTDSVKVSCDGQNDYALQTGDTIHISRASSRVRLIHPANHDHFDIMRNKLGWGGRRV